MANCITYPGIDRAASRPQCSGPPATWLAACRRTL